MFAFAQELQSLNQKDKELQRGGPGVTAVPARKGGWWVAVTAARVTTSYHNKLLVFQRGGGLLWPPSRLRSGSCGELLAAVQGRALRPVTLARRHRGSARHPTSSCSFWASCERAALSACRRE